MLHAELKNNGGIPTTKYNGLHQVLAVVSNHQLGMLSTLKPDTPRPDASDIS